MYLQFEDIYNRYLKEPDYGTFLQIRHLDPRISFSYKEKDFNDFAGYIDELGKMYPNGLMYFLPEEALIKELTDEKRLDDSVSRSIHTIYQTYAGDEKMIIEALLDTFSKTGEFFCDGKKYSSMSEFVKSLIEGSDTHRLALEDKSPEVFYNFFKVNYSNVSSDDINSLLAIEDVFGRHLLLTKLVLGNLNLSKGDTSITCLKDFIDFNNRALSTNNREDLTFIYDFIKAGKFRYVASNEKNGLDFYNTVAVYKNITYVMSAIYYYSQKDVSYSGCRSPEQLIQFLSSQKSDEELLKTSNRINNDPNFFIWMNSKGYKVKMPSKFYPEEEIVKEDLTEDKEKEEK